MTRTIGTVLVVAAAAVLVPAPAVAQQPARRWERRGFDFAPDGVWRRRAARVREARLAALARGDLDALNAPVRQRAPLPSAMAVTGVLRVPVILARPSNVAAPFSQPTYDSVFFATTPPQGRPFTVRTFYEQMSNGTLSVQGQALGWADLSQSDTFYEGGAGCYGLCGSSGVPRLMAEAVAAVDGTVDFGQFDSDGPDGVPNSGDDDGVVDLAVFIHPEIGGECGTSNIWAHRFFYSGWTGATLGTNDARSGGGTIRINSYTIQSGVGGATSCDGGVVMPVGTVAHETGHGFGLPDFYDTNPDDADDSEGIGEWGLMGSGNYATSHSPAHMEGFSRMELGWVTLRGLTSAGTYTLGPYTVGDTIFRIQPTVTNSRGEYFLLENRQGTLGDSALIRLKGPGLLVWHVDGQQYAAGLNNGMVNSGPIHGLWLLQADGLNQLRSSTNGVRNRGDGGDPFPGSSGNTRLGTNTNPSINLNTGAFSGFVIDSIRQVVTGGELAFRLRFGGLTVVQASDTTAQVRVRGTAYSVFREVLDDGDTATVSVDSVQATADGRTRWTFLSWSDGLARTHQLTTALAGSTFTANVRKEHRLQVVVNGTGTVTTNRTGVDPSDVFLPDADTIRLTATPGSGQVFLRWTGDTISLATAILVRMGRPYAITAFFQEQLAVADSQLRTPVMGASYADTLRMSGGTGAYVFQIAPGGGTMPPGLSLSNTGAVSGIPTRDSTYTVLVQVTSGTQQLQFPLRLTVTAPALALNAVVNAFLGRQSGLTSEEVRYLDLLGNQNSVLDLGDFVAFLDKTGLQVDAQTMRRIAERWR